MEIWRHVSTGNLYVVKGSGRLEKDGDSGQKYIIYRSLDTGITWIRPASEFMDGRFQLIADED